MSCNEALPSYDDPRNIIEGRMEALYVVSRFDNSVKVYMLLVNKFDETIQALTDIAGEFTVVWSADPAFRRTFAVSAANLLYARNYDPVTRILTFDPHDTIRFGVSWDLVSDSGDSLRGRLNYRPDPSCPGQFISDPVVLQVSGEMKVYERIPSAPASARQYAFRHVREWVLCSP